MIHKQKAILCILLSMSLNAKALDFNRAQGDGQCPSGYALATPQEARTDQTSACGVLGTWEIARLADGGSMDGSGYDCKIRDSDTRELGHSLCIQQEIQQPVDEQVLDLEKVSLRVPSKLILVTTNESWTPG